MTDADWAQDGGRLLGLDVGSKTIGIALSDPLGVTAQTLEVWRRKTIAQDLQHIADLCDRHGVEVIVIGHPLRTDGSTGPEAKRIQSFARQIQNEIKKSVVLWDERFTTKIAHDALIQSGVRRGRRREVVDKVAAALILQSYLDRKGDQRWANLPK